jgi:pSer/pThr/pTyr-binding forkhead associated (FHA) protein
MENRNSPVVCVLPLKATLSVHVCLLLTFPSPSMQSRSVEMGNVATVGRALSCTVIIPPTLVGQSLIRRISREHCTLWSSLGVEQTVLLNNSGNDTFVDGKRVEYHRRLHVQHGSVIALCSVDSQASFTYYDNYLSHFDYHFELTNRYLVMSVLASG